MSHTPDCRKTRKPLDGWVPCDCFEPDTDWAPEQPCGGISTSVNGGPRSEPPWCEVHMKPWGHRRPLTPAPPAMAYLDARRRLTDPDTTGDAS